MENQRKAGGSDLGNICFFTHSRLINMATSEIAAIEPDYIILDEYHCCGTDVFDHGLCLPSDNKMMLKEQNRTISAVRGCFA